MKRTLQVLFFPVLLSMLFSCEQGRYTETDSGVIVTLTTGFVTTGLSRSHIK